MIAPILILYRKETIMKRFYISLQFFANPELASRDAKIKDLQATIGVLCGGKPAPAPGEPAPKKGGNISPTLKALLR